MGIGHGRNWKSLFFLSDWGEIKHGRFLTFRAVFLSVNKMERDILAHSKNLNNC